PHHGPHSFPTRRSSDLARAVDDDIVAVRVRRPEAVDAPCGQRGALKDRAEERLRVVVELTRRRVLEDRRELALQVPRVEEELPRSEEHTSELQSRSDLV